MTTKPILPCLMLALVSGAALQAQTERPQAAATVAGKGSSHLGFEPSLTSSAPVLGDEVTVTVAELPPSSQGLMLVSFAPPVATMLDDGGVLYLDLADFSNWLMLPIEMEPDGGWRLSFYLDNVTALGGVGLTLQAVVFAPDGPEMTNGLEWTIGY